MLISLLTHAPIFAHFSKNHRDFIVRERPAYSFSGRGEWLIVRACKRDLTTQNLLSDIASATGIKARDIGYAGLKDREGYTEQFLSLPRSAESAIRAFEHPKASLHIENYHDNKLKIGHLIGNSFFIRLKKVNPIDAQKLKQSFSALEQNGFANYFGYQRFGRTGENARLGEELLRDENSFARKGRKKLNKFLISALQSELFNEVLAARVKLSRIASSCSKREFATLLADEKELFEMILHPGAQIISQEPASETAAQEATAQLGKNGFLLLADERYLHYPFGKVFSEDLATAASRFAAKDLAPAGLILGAKAEFGAGLAGKIERAIMAPFAPLLAQQNGSARHYVSFLSDLKTRYDEQKAHFCAEFFLQKGCYATAVLEQALGKTLRDFEVV